MKKKTNKNSIESKNENPQGYPHYPAQDDMMNANADRRVDAELEEFSREQPQSSLKEKKPAAARKSRSTDFIAGTEADVNRDDLMALGSVHGDNDEGEDELVFRDVDMGHGFSGDDLDVPGAELDDDMEDLGSEDEENNFYSRGQS